VDDAIHVRVRMPAGAMGPVQKSAVSIGPAESDAFADSADDETTIDLPSLSPIDSSTEVA
ncbi:MAG: GTPase HflX, partial [Pirellulaceae bacterium]|nr:GTPase HflX [Pirellulaceae bacterium]